VVEQLVLERPKRIVIFGKTLSLYEVIPPPRMDDGQVVLVKGNIARADEVREAIRGIDYVIHTASLLFREASEKFREALEVNIVGTFNLLEASIISGVKKFIYSSSITIYEDSSVLPMNEEHPFRTESMYGASKVCSELFLRAFKKNKGLNYIALRYSLVYGPRQHGTANILSYIQENFDRIERGFPPIIYGDGSQPYDYIYVEDAARANLVALKSSVTGEALNIGSGAAPTVKEVVQTIAEVTGTNLHPVYAPRGNRFRLENLLLDVTKAERLLDFKARVPLKEGLTRYFNWRKNQKGGGKNTNI
jgi:UDP-glucose 4-epimerase